MIPFHPSTIRLAAKTGLAGGKLQMRHVVLFFAVAVTFAVSLEFLASLRSVIVDKLRPSSDISFM